MRGSESFRTKMEDTARKLGHSLVLPEPEDPRILEAACILRDRGLASRIWLAGKQERIHDIAKNLSIGLHDIDIIDPELSPRHTEYAQEYFNLRKNRGMNEEEAMARIKDPLIWASMMVRRQDAGAMVAGVQNATANVLRASFQVVGTAKGIKFASSCFVMDFPETRFGENGLLIFADCATIPSPDAHQLTEITLASANTCRSLLQCEPRVAMLSFSTKGSATHPAIDKVKEAMAMVQQREPMLCIDGELQLDCALIAEIAEIKAPSSPVAGRSNTLIFPDLQSGNIGYKIAQHMGGAGAYGPILQGFSRPVSDLSRGATVDDIVSTCCITLAMENPESK